MEKRRKILYILYCLLFFITCAVPGVMLLRPSDDSSAEKRQLAAFPSLHLEDGTLNKEWNSQFQAYVSDHFGFRQSLVSANNHLQASLLHHSAEEDVILGTEGWLYYTPTVNDYIGNPTVSPLGIQNIVHNLELMQTYTESKGSTFVAAVVPNKNTIYPEYMPDNYRKSGIANNLENLTAAMENSIVNWCPLTDALSIEAETSETILYHKTDTHWNNTGALVGYRAMMKSTGLAYTNYQNVRYKTTKSWNGDLQGMLFPGSEELDYQNEYQIDFTYSYLGHYMNSDDITINTLSPTGSGSLLMFRDSFGAAVIPYLSQQFETARYSRARPNPLYNLETEDFEVVIMEIVERNIAWLQKEAPMHAALKAKKLPKTDSECTGTLYTDQNGNTLLQLYGTVTLPGGLEHAPTYYISLVDETGKAASYLAYNCYEAGKFGEDTVQDNGYSLYIPLDSLVSGQIYTVTLTADTEQGCMGCTLGEITAP